MRTVHILFVRVLIVGLLGLSEAAIAQPDQPRPGDGWTADFTVAPDEWQSTGRNPYFVLEPGYQLVLENDEHDERLVITVLDETKMIDGIETRIVEERESENGEVIEVSRNFFAMSRRTNSVYYFGEEVDLYVDGKVTGHAGAWLSGENGARFGLMMPGDALLGAQYYQEIAPGVAMDRAKIVSRSRPLKTPADDFEHCLVIEETTPLEPAEREFKYYVRGIGLVQDGSLKLVKHGEEE